MSDMADFPIRKTVAVEIDAADVLRSLTDDQIRAECARRGIGPHGAVELTGACVRGARGMLDWSVARLASASGLSVSTIKRFEVEGRCPARPGNIQALRAALQRGGVQFLDVAGRPGLLHVRPVPPAAAQPCVRADRHPSPAPSPH